MFIIIFISLDFSRKVRTLIGRKSDKKNIIEFQIETSREHTISSKKFHLNRCTNSELALNADEKVANKKVANQIQNFCFLLKRAEKNMKISNSTELLHYYVGCTFLLLITCSASCEIQFTLK